MNSKSDKTPETVQVSDPTITLRGLGFSDRLQLRDAEDGDLNPIIRSI